MTRHFSRDPGRATRAKWPRAMAESCPRTGPATQARRESLAECAAGEFPQDASSWPKSLGGFMQLLFQHSSVRPCLT